MSEEPKVKKVYAIAGGGKVKIGKSADPAKRIRDLQTGSPAKLEIIAESVESEFINESLLHGLFAKDRSHHEWFDIDQDVVRIVFSGSDRIGMLLSMRAAGLVRVMKFFDSESMSDCIRSVAKATDLLWESALLTTEDSDKGSAFTLEDIIDRLKCQSNRSTYREIGRAASIDHKQLIKFADRCGVIGADKLVRLLGVLGLEVRDIDFTDGE